MREEGVDAVEVKAGEPVVLRTGDTALFAQTITLEPDGSSRQTTATVYVERDGVLEVYPDFPGWVSFE